MSTFDIVLKNIITLFICIIIGFICKKRKIINNELGIGLSNLLLTVTLPCTIIFSLQKPFSYELLIEGIIIFFVGFLVYFLGGATSYLLCKILNIKTESKGVYIYGNMLPNIVFMGLPVLTAIFGSDAVFYISIINIPFNILVFTIGIKIINIGYNSNTEGNLKTVFKTPAIIFTIIGLLLFMFSIKLPEPINNGIGLIGGITTPLSMIIIGSVLAKSDLSKHFKTLKMYAFIFLKLVILPIITLFIFRMFIPAGIVLGIIVLTAAMPPATTTVIMAEKYEANSEFSSVFVCIATIISIITIPAISILLEH